MVVQVSILIVAPGCRRLGRCPNSIPQLPTEVPWSDAITRYDEAHFVTYIRLLDAEAVGAAWHEAARLVLHLDPNAEPHRAWRCWEAHLKGAKWMAEHGYRHLLSGARHQ